MTTRIKSTHTPRYTMLFPITGLSFGSATKNGLNSQSGSSYFTRVTFHHGSCFFFSLLHLVSLLTFSFLGNILPFTANSASFFSFQGCNEVKVLGKTKPTCPKATPDVPSRPENLTYVFIIANKVRQKAGPERYTRWRSQSYHRIASRIDGPQSGEPGQRWLDNVFEGRGRFWSYSSLDLFVLSFFVI